jgi:excisionase family DNA binding protein
MEITRQTRFDELPELLTPEEARAVLGISRNGVYELLRRNELPHTRYGRLIRIPRSALQRPASAVR